MITKNASKLETKAAGLAAIYLGGGVFRVASGTDPVASYCRRGSGARRSLADLGVLLRLGIKRGEGRMFARSFSPPAGGAHHGEPWPRCFLADGRAGGAGVSASQAAAPVVLVVLDRATLQGVDAAVEALGTLYGRLAAGERGPDMAAGLLTVAALLTALAGSYAPPQELGRIRQIWAALDRAAGSHCQGSDHDRAPA